MIIQNEKILFKSIAKLIKLNESLISEIHNMKTELNEIKSGIKSKSNLVEKRTGSNVNRQKSLQHKSPLFDILSDIKPLDESDTSTSILDGMPPDVSINTPEAESVINRIQSMFNKE